MRNRIKLGCSLLFITLTLAPAADVPAFFQKTTVEGTIANDIGGVWLAVQHIMPTFRVRLDREEDTVAPFEVGPVTEDLASLMGKDVHGVVVTEFFKAGVSGAIGVFPGDIVTKVNTHKITDVQSWETALTDVKSWFLMTVRRSRLKHSKAQLVKIRYEATEIEAGGVSAIGAETIRWQVSDALLPFAREVERTRRNNELFVPSAEQIESLASGWHELDVPERPIFVSGEHRIVAADDYDASLRKDENLDGTLFAVVSQFTSNPLAGSSGKLIGIAGIHEASATELTGSYVESTMASAPFPISVDFNGTITLTRIADFSNADGAHRAALAASKAGGEDAKDVELAPDVPAEIEPVDLSAPVAQ